MGLYGIIGREAIERNLLCRRNVIVFGWRKAEVSRGGVVGVWRQTIRDATTDDPRARLVKCLRSFAGQFHPSGLAIAEPWPSGGGAVFQVGVCHAASPRCRRSFCAPPTAPGRGALHPGRAGRTDSATRSFSRRVCAEGDPGRCAKSACSSAATRPLAAARRSQL